ncbi:hypothetical protein GCM10007415_00440 [Parapedobacter pyrenivorans]|uniref:Uncharacterized protein n=1 Tax=Parapedobacter pyrenivorans TaxID=1305674 RepID=A0A917HBX3_9SPHI|nr:hypothetical protein [Parapedobacter pyrenivorans]GGG73025.1 hypothetical protein GCM10007415_00440 [Parapedobacter pyrenivorans]
MEKLDLTGLYKTYISITATPEIVDSKPTRFLSLTDEGDLSSDVFLQKIRALYATAYAIKFKWKQAGRDFIVPKLEVLRYRDGKNAGDWRSRLLIRVPEYVTEYDMQKGIECVMANMNIQRAANIKMHYINTHTQTPIIKH